MRFVEQAELAREAERRAAVFSPGSQQGAKPLARLQSLFRRAPRPEQGIIVAKRLYDSLGGHRDGAADCEADLLRRLGRTRLAVLRTAIIID
jgi:hypothetical protein